MEHTKSGDVIISRRSGKAVCVVTRVLDDGDETGPVEYMGRFDAEARARQVATETIGRVWERVDGGDLRPFLSSPSRKPAAPEQRGDARGR